MNRFVGFSTSVVLGFGLVFGLTGCQSGWKISNPFASHPRAASAETPEELDALDDMDELTPPPENYTVGDASKSDRSESLAQKGKYEVEDKASDVEKIENETRAIAEKTDSYKSQESYQVADYNQSYQTNAPTGVGEYAAQDQASTQSYAQTNLSSQQSYSPAEQSPLQSQQSYAQADQGFQQPYSPTNQPVQQSYDQPYAQTNQAPAQTVAQNYAQVPANSGFQAYSAPGVGVDVAANDRFEPAQSAAPSYANGVGTATNVESGFPSVDSSFPTAQNSNVALSEDFPQVTFGAAPSSSQPVHVAMNPESNVVTGAAPASSQPSTHTTGAPTDSDPYSDVYYSPQTTSSGAGFAPGSAGLY